MNRRDFLYRVAATLVAKPVLSIVHPVFDTSDLIWSSVTGFPFHGTRQEYRRDIHLFTITYYDSGFWSHQ